jgi:hypothetical protein
MRDLGSVHEDFARRLYRRMERIILAENRGAGRHDCDIYEIKERINRRATLNPGSQIRFVLKSVFYILYFIFYILYFIFYILYFIFRSVTSLFMLSRNAVTGYYL